MIDRFKFIGTIWRQTLSYSLDRSTWAKPFEDGVNTDTTTQNILSCPRTASLLLAIEFRKAVDNMAQALHL
jgi:hypothetical protein